MLTRHGSILAFASVPVLAIALAACGGGDDNSTSTTGGGATASASSGGTVTESSVDGVGEVLADANGNALYTNDQDSGSKIACTGECTSIWPPLAAPSNGQPTSGDSSIQAKLGVVKRSDGTSQVTFDGSPLYTFAQDSPGQANGNGVADSFGGTSFMWTAATRGGGAPSAPQTTTSSGSSGGGGYSY
jgi:predicted lipoprotein with Yx(FWY)xxD motif